MKLIVGLGNPGAEYEKTRHNVGFFIVDRLAEDWGVKITRKKFSGYYGEHHQGHEKVVLVKPQTMMNLSGDGVVPWLKFLKISGQDLLVIHDELDLPLGRFRGQWAGGAGGHNGIRSILEVLGHPEFCRLRVGIGHPGRSSEVVRYVLSPFTPEQEKQVEEIVKKGVEAAQLFVKMGLDGMMGMVNRRP